MRWIQRVGGARAVADRSLATRVRSRSSTPIGSPAHFNGFSHFAYGAVFDGFAELDAAAGERSEPVVDAVHKYDASDQVGDDGRGGRDEAVGGGGVRLVEVVGACLGVGVLEGRTREARAVTQTERRSDAGWVACSAIIRGCLIGAGCIAVTG